MNIVTPVRHFAIALKVRLQKKSYRIKIILAIVPSVIFYFYFPLSGDCRFELVELLFPTSVTPDLVESITEAVTETPPFTWGGLCYYIIGTLSVNIGMCTMSVGGLPFMNVVGMFYVLGGLCCYLRI